VPVVSSLLDDIIILAVDGKQPLADILRHAVPSGAGAESCENIACVNHECEREFPVNLPGPLVDGPFPKP